MMRRSNEGETVEAEGGQVVRSTTGRKDRHSKVYTSKGPRDRRVRLSAHTAIEFYDVQDRLGYDRPSKAVDWLIKKAKPSIDKLAELPPWNPQTNKAREEGQNSMVIGEPSESCGGGGYNFHGNHSAAEFISPPHVGLSLHSFQEDHTGLINPWQSQVQACDEAENHAQASINEQHQNQTLFAAGSSTSAGFENNHYQRIVTWNNEATNDYINKVGFMVNSETLQSSFSPSVRSWNEIVRMASSSESEHYRSQQVHQASVFGGRFLSDGFCSIPETVVQDEEEEDHGVAASNRLSSASPSSHN